MRADREDVRLVDAYRRGDDAAFEMIFDRYRPMLLRYARRVLGGSVEYAEDVVQESMWRAARALRRDRRHIELKPWLFRLVRNCALDEISRVRSDSVDLDVVDEAGVLRAPEALEPERAAERRSQLRDVIGDLSLLPADQRHALVRRELDGLSHAQLATELGLSEQASRNLVFRARANLVKHRDARTSSCEDRQRDLLTAHDAQRRASALSYRHLATCGDCRAFRAALRSQRKAIAFLSPGPLLLTGGLAVVGVKAAGATAKGTGAKAALTAAAVATVGAVGTVQVFTAGDASPQAVESRAVPGGDVRAGEPLPHGTAIVRATAALAAGSSAPRIVRLACPTGLRAADLLPASGTPATVTYAPSTIVGADRVARLVIEPRDAAPRARRVLVSVLCKRPDREGSIVASGRSGGRRGFAAGVGDELEVTARSASVHAVPAGPVIGTVRRAQPVDTRGRAQDGWIPVVTDTDERGWVREDVVAPR